MSTAMFVKSALAMLITIGFAGGAVYYGTNSVAPASNEVELRTPQKIERTETVSEKANILPIQQDVDKPEDISTAEEMAKPEQNSEQISEPISNLETVIDTRLNLAEIMPLLMKQTRKISAVGIKDQAYLDIVSFSVSQRQFKFADAAMQEIDQTELRDTARSQIAIGLALDGRADDAFEVIDAVEIDTLRDVMRLQVIEALIIPGKLPPGLIRQ
ncbi:MAG: hypothetical protein L3J05_03425 [Robiginitomaculum sp.]|nr:hypothetical protein [Robiginitomaculum sp.]